METTFPEVNPWHSSMAIPKIRLVMLWMHLPSNLIWNFFLEFIGGADDMEDVSVPPISCRAWEGSLISELHPGARFGKLILDNLSGAPFSPSLSPSLPFSLSLPSLPHSLINMLQLHTLEQPYASFCKHSHARRRSAINQETSEYDENGSETGHLRTCPPPPQSSGKCISNKEERER